MINSTLSYCPNQFWQNIHYTCFVPRKTICDQLKYHTLHLTETASKSNLRIYPTLKSQTQRLYTDETSIQRGHVKLKLKLSFVFPRALSHARSLQRFLFWNPLRTRETPRRALPCVSNEFTWRPTVYQRHFLPVYVRVCRIHACVRVRAARPACGQRFPAAADVGPSSRGPLEIRNLVWLYPICPPRAGPYRLAGFFVRLGRAI